MVKKICWDSNSARDFTPLWRDIAGLWSSEDFPHYSIPPERWSDADFEKRLHLKSPIYYTISSNIQPCSAIYLGFSNTSCHECKLISIKTW